MWQGLTSRSTASSTDPGDPGSLGVTYGIPFATVWDIVVALADGGLRGWSLTSRDEVAGIVEARVRGRILPFPATVVIVVSLDENAQTLVEISAESLRGGGDLGVNARRIQRFRIALERALAADASRTLNGRPATSAGP